jgi:hypothetical protein
MSIHPQSDNPAEPDGWFRWLHNAYAGRRALFERLSAEGAKIDWKSADADLVSRHPWEAGDQLQLGLLERLWGRLTPSQRGNAAAGASESKVGMQWLATRLGESALDAVATCQLACNAARWKQDDLLSSILSSSSDLTGEVTRYDGPGRRAGRFSETIAQLSSRCIDLVLEAALISKNSVATRLALAHGANPDIPIWVLERSFSEKHCALSFCIENRMKDSFDALLTAGASPGGIPFCTPNLPLFHAISTSLHTLAIKLLKCGGSFSDSEMGDQRKRTIADIRLKKPRLISPSRDYFFGHCEEDLEWVRVSIAPILALVAIEEKPCFYIGNCQGGHWSTFLDIAGNDVKILRRYKKLGLDARPSPEEFLSAIESGSHDKLLFLLSGASEGTKARVMFRVRRRNPSFGACAPLSLLPQDDRVNDAINFDPGSQKPLILPDGSALHIDLAAIAAPGHDHGACLSGHFWHLTEEPTMRRRGKLTIMKRLRIGWKMSAQPQNIREIQNLLPVVRRLDGRYIRLGCTLQELSLRVQNKWISGLLEKWRGSALFDEIASEAKRRISAQDQWNSRLPEPSLTREELDGYPNQFWPFLDRLDTGFIGMSRERADVSVFREYRAWERRNKMEDSFVPDPRIVDYDIWHELPPELRPFLAWDDLFDRPGLRNSDGSEYEEAMVRKATKWWNASMTAKMQSVIAKGSTERGE